MRAESLSRPPRNLRQPKAPSKAGCVVVVVVLAPSVSFVSVGVELCSVDHVLPGHLGLDALLRTALAHGRVVVDLCHDDFAALLGLAVSVAPFGGAGEVMPAGIVASVPLAHDAREGARELAVVIIWKLMSARTSLGTRNVRRTVARSI